MDASSAESPADTEPGTEGEPRRRRWPLALVLAPLVIGGLVVVAWAVDTSLGGVPRNVRLAGMDIGGLSEDELSSRVTAAAGDFSATPVEITAGDATYDTTAGDIGLMIDQDRTVAKAMEVGNESFVLLRPLSWLASFITPRDATLQFQVSDEQVAATTIALEGDARTPPTEPTFELVDGTFHVVAGKDGRGIDPARVAAALPDAAAMADHGTTIRISVDQGPVPPLGSPEEARAAASDAEHLVDQPIEIQTSGGNRTISSDDLRSWATLVSNLDGTVTVGLDPTKVSAGLRAAFADLEGHPIDATFTLNDGVPIIRPDQPGKVCCGGDPATTIDGALHDGKSSVALELVDGPAAFTVANAQSWGITQAVGGNNAWRDGAPTTAGPGFTTYHAATGARVINIHRIADLVRGAVVPPGASFSINDYVGKRTTEKGFVAAGAISNGEHVDEIGGGISQFATTTFNAAYFAGLDIDVYQAHSEYFDRYPRGREATMGYPAPDLKFTNSTPYGILIWTSYTNTSLTVTLYSTPYATAQQTGISEGTSGSCRTVTTTRTRTFPDGHTEDDTFRARYRPGPGQGC